MVRPRFTNVTPRLNIVIVFARSEKVLGSIVIYLGNVTIKVARRKPIYNIFAHLYGSDWFLQFLIAKII